MNLGFGIGEGGHDQLGKAQKHVGVSDKGRRARFLDASEFADLRKQISGGSKGDGPFGRRMESEKGRQRAKRTLEGGKSHFPPPKGRWGTERADEPIP
jgi:hypothetical protein